MIRPPTWTILIPTLGSRRAQFLRLISDLFQQTAQYGSQIEVLSYWNQGELPLNTIRQRLLEESRGLYVNFIDDDDRIPDYYASLVMSNLDGEVDYIGWRMQVTVNGRPLKPTVHSLDLTGWSEDDQYFYRDISHLNPMKRAISRQGNFTNLRVFGEDSSWAGVIRNSRRPPKTEKFIDEIMYYYEWSSSGTSFPGQNLRVPSGCYERPHVSNQQFRWHPASARELEV